MSDSTVTRINEEYGREQFKDFEIDINDGGRGDEGGDVLPIRGPSKFSLTL